MEILSGHQIFTNRAISWFNGHRVRSGNGHFEFILSKGSRWPSQSTWGLWTSKLSETSRLDPFWKTLRLILWHVMFDGTDFQSQWLMSQCTNRSITPYCIRRLGSGLFRREACTTMQKLPLKRLGSGSTRTRLSRGGRGQSESWCRDAQWRRKLNVSSEITGRIFLL